MALSTVVIENSSKKSKFPKLMQSSWNGVIVLMAECCVGMVVGNPSDSFANASQVGYQSKHWNKARFSDYKGSLVLTNKKQ